MSKLNFIANPLHRAAVGLNNSLTIILLCLINLGFKICNVAILVKNDAAVTFIHFVMEIVAATFIAVVTIANFVVALSILYAIGFSFV